MAGIKERHESRFLKDLLTEVGTVHDWRHPALAGPMERFVHEHAARYRRTDRLLEDEFGRVEPHASDLVRMIDAAILGIVCVKTIDDRRCAQTWVTGIARAQAISRHQSGDWRLHPQSGQLNWVGMDAAVRISDTIRVDALSWLASAPVPGAGTISIEIDEDWDWTVRRSVMWSPIWWLQYWKPGRKTDYRCMSKENRAQLGVFVSDYSAREALRYAREIMESDSVRSQGQHLCDEAKWGPHWVNDDDDSPVFVANAH